MSNRERGGDRAAEEVDARKHAAAIIKKRIEKDCFEKAEGADGKGKKEKKRRKERKKKEEKKKSVRWQVVAASAHCNAAARRRRCGSDHRRTIFNACVIICFSLQI
jgi:hypothetical protein